ncbi:GSCOCG00012981001-RA-CDS, partial [Cotesia congregata]
KGPARKASLLKKIILTKLQEDGDVRKHISDFSDAVKELSEIGVAINDEVLAIILMYSLPASFSMFRTAIESRDELPSTAVLKIKIIEDYEGRSNQPVEAGALYSKSNNKYYDKKRCENDFNRTQGHSQPSENRICYKCGKHGHIAKNCSKKKGKKPCHSSSQVENDAGSSPTTFMKGKVWARADRIGNLYYVRQCQEVVNNVEMESLSRKMIDIWHERLGHVNERDLKSMAKHGLVDGLKISDSDKLSECEVCAREKQACKPFPTGNQER